MLLHNLHCDCEINFVNERYYKVNVTVINVEYSSAWTTEYLSTLVP